MNMRQNARTAPATPSFLGRAWAALVRIGNGIRGIGCSHKNGQRKTEDFDGAGRIYFECPDCKYKGPGWTITKRVVNHDDNREFQRATL